MSNRCETCTHFVAWPKSFQSKPEGVCTAPRPYSMPQGNREVRKWDGEECQVWTAKEMRDDPTL
jgi:hypothetical protein